MSISVISDHVSQALSRLLEQYKKKTNLLNLVTSLVNPLQELEGVFQDLSNLRALNTSAGAQLDALGKLLGLARVSGQDDATYLTLLKTQINVNLSQGEPERVLSVAQVLIGASQVMLLENFPSTYSIMTEVPLSDQNLINFLFNSLKSISPTGVTLEAIGSFNPTNAFKFDGSLSGGGFGSVNNSSNGGMFATVYLNKTKVFAMDGSTSTQGGFGTVTDSLVGGVLIGVS